MNMKKQTEREGRDKDMNFKNRMMLRIIHNILATCIYAILNF